MQHRLWQAIRNDREQRISQLESRRKTQKDPVMILHCQNKFKGTINLLPIRMQFVKVW